MGAGVRNWLVVGTVAVAVVGAGIAGAAAGGGKPIHSCVSKASGVLRIAKKCKHRERAISWNQSGPAGPHGAQGATGRIGPQGPAGQNGQNGLNGAPGSARAYADVSDAGGHLAFKTGAVQGFTAVRSPSGGVYCLTPAAGITPATSTAIVSAHYFSGQGPTLPHAYLDDADSFCNSGEFTVVTFSGPNQAAGISFTILVP
jgi:hypothetical protein